MRLTGCGGTFRDGAALLCAIALLALGGCGGSSASSPSGSSPSAPSIGGAPVTQVAVGGQYSFTPSVRSAGGRAVSFSIRNKPAWASFSIATGELTGTPTSSNVGRYPNIVISVSNGAARSSLAAFTIIVSQGSGGTATLSWTAPTTNTDGSPLTDLAGYTIQYGTNSASLSQSVNISNPGTTTYTLEGLTAGTWYFAIVANTTSGSQSPLSNVVSATIS